GPDERVDLGERHVVEVPDVAAADLYLDGEAERGEHGPRVRIVHELEARHRAAEVGLQREGAVAVVDRLDPGELLREVCDELRDGRRAVRDTCEGDLALGPRRIRRAGSQLDEVAVVD